MAKIYIGTPTGEGKINHLQTQSLIAGVHGLISKFGHKVNYITVPQNSVSVARNLITSKFLYSDFDYVIFIDDDVVFNPQDLFKLANYPEEYKVISGAYVRRSNGISDDFTHTLMDGEKDKTVAKALYTGGGFLRIAKSVFKDLEKDTRSFRHPSVQKQENQYLKTYFDARFEDSQFISEDVDFCNKCHNNNIDTYVDQSIRVGHSFEIIQ